MMGVAENIADLRSLLSIVAEDTGALVMSDPDEDSVGWTADGPLPMTFGHVRRAHAALAALEEAALSTDAEPVAYRVRMNGKVWQLRHVIHEFDKWDIIEALYAGPVKTAPAVVVKDACTPDLLLYNLLMEAINEGVAKATDPDWTTKDFGKSPYYQAIHAALSAQVQDVAVPALKIGIYGKAYDRPDERRAYTYDDQPHNVEAHKLGRACSGIHSGGDWIDRGLNLLKALQAEGFGVFELLASKHGGP